MAAIITFPKSIKAGETVEIKTLFSHHMETGYRREMSGVFIPRDIIKHFQIKFENKLVFEAILSPAISANPYFSFMFLALKSGEMTFIWRDEKGVESVETRFISVV